jgi:putative ABC transport system substrate-binding protein
MQVEYRSAEGKLDRLPALAAELVDLKVDIIVASETPAVQAAKRATTEIPIVMAPSGDPVGTGSQVACPGQVETSQGCLRRRPSLRKKSRVIRRCFWRAAWRAADPANAFAKSFRRKSMRQLKPLVLRFRTLCSVERKISNPFSQAWSVAA